MTVPTRIPRFLAAALVGFALATTLRAQQPPAAPLAPDTSWVARSTLYEVFVRDFSPTGDLRGVTRGLPRIVASGANTIWLMPIQPVGVLNRKGTLGSPYSLKDYHAIDPAFGAADDLRELVRAAHARGLKVILDWVPDHTSWDNVWVTEHPEYYVHDPQGRLVVPRDPQGHPTDWTDVAQLDYGNAGLRQAMIAELRWWLETYDLDGYRMDVAGFIPDDFWREAIAALRARIPRPLLFLAEAGELRMHRDGFDLTYGWDAYARLKAVFRGASADTLVHGELADQRDMPPGGMRLRFTTNHDETAWDNPPVTLFGSPAAARAAFVAIALLPGRPLLYNGQEVESPQKLALFERDSIAWNQPDAAEARAFFRRVLQLTRRDPAIRAGNLAAVETSAPADVIAYRRGERTAVLVNARNRETRITVTGFDVEGARDLLTGRVQRGATVGLAPYAAMVLRRR
jgi:glycosidase